MAGMRAILLLVAALIGGPVFIFSGITEYKNSKALKADGKAIVAQVVNGEETVGRKGRRKYWLTVAFAPESGASVNETASVSSTLFQQAMADRSVKLTYLPSNPHIFQFGEKVETRTGSIIFGSLVLAGALGFLAYLFFQWRSSRSTEPAGISVNAGTSGSISVNAGSVPPPNDQQKAA
jgi:hypothetical protein